MAHLRDERGNPVELTDEHGNPVKLTDEYGNPIHLSGVAFRRRKRRHQYQALLLRFRARWRTGPHGGPAGTHGGPPGRGTLGAALEGGDVGGQHQARRDQTRQTPGGGLSKEIQHTGAGSSSSAKARGEYVEGGRRKKKGLGEKIKDKLMGGKHKDQENVEVVGGTTLTTSTVTTLEHHEHDNEHEKKGMMDKIKEKMPGHH
ncbi:Late embryogenesis abundant protein [Bienertia sinuspersici]